MRHRLLTSSLALLLAGLASVPAFAQAAKKQMVPVLNANSGKLEAVLVLEPATAGAGMRWKFGSTRLETTLGLESGDSLALVCGNGFAPAFGQLAANCKLASVDGDAGTRRANAGASVSRGGNRLGLNLGSGRGLLPGWLTPGSGQAKVQQNDLSLFAEKTISREGYVSVGGAVARARLVPASDMPALADEWNTRSVSVGGGYGAFGASIIGRVVNVPGESNVWKGLGLGLTWRTPWSGQLSVGAENVVTRGRNPFSIERGADDDHTAVPYVRYQQDL